MTMTVVPERELVHRQASVVLAQHAKSFRWASCFLPRRMRLDAAVVYAFCRLVDDAADEATDSHAARLRLRSLRGMLDGLERPSDLVAAYIEVVTRTGVGLGPARALLTGVESDLGLVIVRDDAELLTYCYRVAGTVGLMMCGVLGVSAADARSHAVELGIAMQLTNISRDVREDAELGRVYLPRLRLLASGVREDTLDPQGLLDAERAERSNVALTVLGLIADAERSYVLAANGYADIPARGRLAVMVAANLYRAIGQRLARTGGDALSGRTVVPTWQKLCIVISSLVAWLLTLTLPRPQRDLLRGRANPSLARQAEAHPFSAHPQLAPRRAPRAG